MRPENVGEFTRRFNAYVEENIDPQMLVPQVDVDAELLFSEITPAFRRELKRFEPFGPGNAAPIFATRSVSNRGDAKLVGGPSANTCAWTSRSGRNPTDVAVHRLPAAGANGSGWMRPVDGTWRTTTAARYRLSGHQAGGEIAQSESGCGFFVRTPIVW